MQIKRLKKLSSIACVMCMDAEQLHRVRLLQQEIEATGHAIELLAARNQEGAQMQDSAQASLLNAMIQSLIFALPNPSIADVLNGLDFEQVFNIHQQWLLRTSHNVPPKDAQQFCLEVIYPMWRERVNSALATFPHLAPEANKTEALDAICTDFHKLIACCAGCGPDRIERLEDGLYVIYEEIKKCSVESAALHDRIHEIKEQLDALCLCSKIDSELYSEAWQL